MKVGSVILSSLAAISLAGACSGPPTPLPGDQSNGNAMAEQITFSCAPAARAEVDEPDRICAELLSTLQETRPDLRFVSGTSGPPAARFVITYATSRGLGLEATWVDAEGASTVGKPLSVSFFDRPSDPDLRQNFYAAFLRENPIPF